MKLWDMLKDKISLRNLQTSSENFESATKPYQIKIQRGAVKNLQPKFANCSRSFVFQHVPKWAVYTGIGILVFGAFFLTACREKGTVGKKIELVYYKFNTDSSAIEPLIQEYESKNNVRITYENFTDLEEYEDRIINEMAEGTGPDIFSIHNTWMSRHYKKINPLPVEKLAPEKFEEVFVNTASRDLILNGPNDKKQIFALPLSVDSLALYYNKSQFEDKIPSRGKPAQTWEELKEDVFKLTKTDNSFERFETAGIAMGRGDNIGHAVDILYLLFLQNGAEFYNKDGSKATFAQRQGTNIIGQSVVPGIDALELFSSFAKTNNKNYSWNEYIAPTSDFKEIEAFARGKVAMFVGESGDYQKVLDAIKLLDSKNIKHIDKDDIATARIPQVFDPSAEGSKRITYASYFAETVSRNSKNPALAWDFLMFLASRKSAQHYFEKTHRPTARRDLIDEQKKDPIYGVFANQVGSADSIQIYRSEKYEKIFLEAIAEALKTNKIADVLRSAESHINDLLPHTGLFPSNKTK